MGQPDFENLTFLKSELKANDQSVSTTLGGGDHSHLGMVLTYEEYDNISDEYFEDPMYPDLMC